MADPWRNWFHCTAGTYGMWLRGDPRGWRSRHHREHVEGDYRNPPPPDLYDELYEQSKRSMKRSAVRLSEAERLIACRKLVEALEHHEVEVVELCVASTHLHALARFEPVEVTATFPTLPHASTNRKPRHLLGLAKTWSAKALANAGLRADLKVWAKRSRPEPIEDREHQLATVQYIRRHRAQGAVVWSDIRDR